MIKQVDINSIDDALQLIADQQYNEKIGRMRSNYLYRGIHSDGFKLDTSLARNCGDKQELLEASILRYFTKYAIKDNPGIADSVWKQMMLGQHHGLPTRLLDWSHSPLIALHFATEEGHIENTGTRDGIVWRIDAKELAHLLPGRYQDILAKDNTEFFTLESIQDVAQDPSTYDKDMGNSAMVIIEPPSTDPRIINQYSYFSVVPMGINNVEKFLEENTERTVKYVISKDIRWAIRDLLDQLNISERVVFPGLDGLSKWIARHYYVK